MSRKIIELRGIQASGKTTLARNLTSKNSDLVRVNKDDLRAMLRGDKYSPKHEPLVKACEFACTSKALEHGYSVVIDDTNLASGSLWSKIAEILGVGHRVVSLDVPVEEAIRRDALRSNPVGATAIRVTAARAKK